MLYRSGYSYKDPGQEHILALSIEREAFLGLLRKSVVASSHDDNPPDSGVKAKREKRERPANVRVQWDPERTVRLEKLQYRSIQIGIPGALVHELVQGIVKIEDVTGRARELKKVLDETEAIDLPELMARGLVLEESEFVLDKELKMILHMDKPNENARETVDTCN